jgi:uncharacterized protein involved in exopolysaccharide biosynthesis
MADEQYTAKDYLNAFRRRSKLFFGIAAAVLAIAVAFALLPPDVYRSSAEMRVDLEGPNIDLLEPVVRTTYADQYIQTLQQKVMSGDNLRKWVNESGAYSHETGLTERELMSQMQGDIRIQMVYTPVMDERSGKEVNLITGFTTAFTALKAEAAEYVANSVASAFLAEDRATRVATAQSAASFLREQIGVKREEIADIESRIATFKEEHAGRLPELMVLNMTAAERTERELEAVEREIRTLQQDRFFRDAQLQEIRQGTGTSGAHLAALEAEYHRAVSLYGPDHPDVMRIRRQVAALTAGASAGGSPEVVQLQAELAAAQERYSDEHPDVISLKRRLKELQSGGPFGNAPSETIDDPLYLQLRAQINAIDSNLQSLRKRAEELRAGQANLQDRIAGMPQVERQYQVLQRELQSATQAYDGLRERLVQAQQVESFESGERGARLQQVRVAQAPEYPTGPPRLAIVILGLFAASTLGGGGAFVAEFTDSTIRGSKDIRAVMHTQAIATVPIVQNSVTRSERRRKLLMMSLSATMLGGIIVLIIASLT